MKGDEEGRLRRGLEIPKQAREGDVVLRMIGPASEVADVALAAELGGPGLPRSLYGVVNSYREEHLLFAFALSLSLQGRFYFVFDPFTFTEAFERIKRSLS